MSKRDKLGVFALCLLCFVLGEYVGRIITTAEIISHFGAEQAEQILHPTEESAQPKKWLGA